MYVIPLLSFSALLLSSSAYAVDCKTIGFQKGTTVFVCETSGAATATVAPPVGADCPEGTECDVATAPEDEEPMPEEPQPVGGDEKPMPGEPQPVGGDEEPVPEEPPVAEEEPMPEENIAVSDNGICSASIDSIYIPQVFLLDNNPGGVSEEDGININLSFLRDPDSMRGEIEAHLAGVVSATVYFGDGGISSSGDPLGFKTNMTAAQSGTPVGSVVKVAHGDAEIYVTITDRDGAGHERNIDLIDFAANAIGTFDADGGSITGVLGDENSIDGAGSVSIPPAITVTYCPELTKQLIQTMKDNQAFGCNGDNGTPNMDTLTCVYQ